MLHIFFIFTYLFLDLDFKNSKKIFVEEIYFFNKTLNFVFSFNTYNIFYSNFLIKFDKHSKKKQKKNGIYLK